MFMIFYFYYLILFLRYYHMMCFKPNEKVAAINMCMTLVDESSSLLLNIDSLDIMSRLLKGFKLRKKNEMFPGLVINWEPLFNLFMTFNFCGKRHKLNSALGEYTQALSDVINVARYFFPEGSTAEILDRIKTIYSFSSSSAYK